MSWRLSLLLAVFAAFGALTVVALSDVGYFGIFAQSFQSWAGGQVLADLVIACALAAIWMTADGRERGISAWPFIALTLAAGSFGVLAYLVVRELRAGAGVRVEV